MVKDWLKTRSKRYNQAVLCNTNKGPQTNESHLNRV